VAIGPMSGRQNVLWFCDQHGISDPPADTIDLILASARQTGRILTMEDVCGILERESAKQSD